MTRQFSSEDLAKVRAYAECGVTVERIAFSIGVSKDYFDELKNKHEALRNALEEGRLVAERNLTAGAYKMAMEGNVAMAIFLLKTRCRYSEPKTEVEVRAIADKESFEDYITKLEVENERTSQTIEVQAEQADSDSGDIGNSISVVRR